MADHRFLPVLPHSFPPRRSSDLSVVRPRPLPGSAMPPEMSPEISPAMHVRPDGIRIAHHHTPPAGSGAALPGVVFLGGFRSDMQGGKALRQIGRAHV